MKFLKKTKLTCVDTFKPFHELKEYNKKKFNKIYKNFKANTSKYSKKLLVVKNTSEYFFKNNKKKFDFIYVDGSHKYKDVLHDAKKAFIHLNNNGIIADYFGGSINKYQSKIFNYIAGIDLDLDAQGELLALDSNGVLYGFNHQLNLMASFPLDITFSEPILSKNILGNDFP